MIRKPKRNRPDVETTTTNSLIDQQAIVDFKRNNTELYLYKYGEIKIEPNVITYNGKIYVTIDSLNPTLEEVKKEWEALGYEFKHFGYKIAISKECIKDEINDSYTVFVKWINIFTKAQQYNSNYLFTYKEHQLLTKLFKALGWYDE